METTKRTPGPWKTDAYGVITGGAGCLTSVCEVPIIKWARIQARAGRENEQEAADWAGRLHDNAVKDAQLITAAPDLLEACKESLEFLYGILETVTPGEGDMLTRMEKAIAKAERTTQCQR